MATYSLTRSDFLSASWFLQRKFRRILFCAALCLGGVAIFLCRREGIGMPISIAMGVAMFVGVFGLRLFLNRLRILRIYDDHVSARSEIELALTEEGLETVFDGGRTDIRWEQLKFWSENARFLLLYQGKDYAQIIPKDALSEEEEKTIRGKMGSLKKI